MASAEVIRRAAVLSLNTDWHSSAHVLKTNHRLYIHMCVCSRILTHSNRENIISVSHLEFPSLAGTFLYQLDAFSISFTTDKVT